MPEEVSKTGVYIDSRTGQVETTPPEEGIQLVPPGGTIDANAQATIETAKAAASARPASTTVTTASTKRAAK